MVNPSPPSLASSKSPPHGVGIGLRREFATALFASDREVDWLEIIPENYIAHGGPSAKILDAAKERWTLRAHGVSLNLGGPDPLNLNLVDDIGALLDSIGADVYTEHACWTGGRGISFHDLLPLPFSEEAASHLAARAKTVREALQRPLLLENISYYAVMPLPPEVTPLDEGAFLHRVLEESGAGLLLDVNNVYVNAINHGHDPLELLRSLPLDKTQQIHVAGHKVKGDFLVDNHGAPVIDPVWDLLTEALRVVGDVPVLLEWDLEIPELDRVLDEADQARSVYRAALGATPEATTPKAAPITTFAAQRQTGAKASTADGALS